MAKIRYFKLGENASAFWDASTRTKITSRTEPTEFSNDGKPKPLSKRMQLALKAGHIVEVEAPAQTEVVEKESGEQKSLEQMNDKELLAYYKANFQTKPSDLKAFKEYSTDEKVKFLKQAEEPEEEEETE